MCHSNEGFPIYFLIAIIHSSLIIFAKNLNVIEILQEQHCSPFGFGLTKFFHNFIVFQSSSKQKAFVKTELGQCGCRKTWQCQNGRQEIFFSLE